MDIIVKTKDVDEIIGFWIEVMYITRTIDNLVEYTDEVGEYYEQVDWLLDDSTGKGGTVMDIHVNLEYTSRVSANILYDVEAKMKAVIIALVESGNGIFESYRDKDISGQIDNVMTYLCEAFDEIYDYSRKEQLENFYKVLRNCLDMMKW